MIVNHLFKAYLKCILVPDLDAFLSISFFLMEVPCCSVFHHLTLIVFALWAE